MPKRKKTELQLIADEVNGCTKCGLCEQRTHTVPGEGNEKAQVLFIGEGPGKEEDEQGRPFVGKSGQFLREMIHLVGLREDDFFITNVVKCRPPGNRDPLPDEIAMCKTYLDRQIKALKPQVIVTLGRYSMAKYVPNTKISDIHGRIFQRPDGVCIMSLYHPAVALYSESQKEVLIRDMRRLPILLDYLKANGMLEAEKPSAGIVNGNDLVSEAARL
jgi:uracil-DNA glycosylase